mgnify:CR=1 FL=1
MRSNHKTASYSVIKIKLCERRTCELNNHKWISSNRMQRGSVISMNLYRVQILLKPLPGFVSGDPITLSANSQLVCLLPLRAFKSVVSVSCSNGYQLYVSLFKKAIANSAFCLAIPAGIYFQYLPSGEKHKLLSQMNIIYFHGIF